MGGPPTACPATPTDADSAALVACLLVAALSVPVAVGERADHVSETETATEAVTETEDDGRIAELYPNPVATGDAGEYVLLDLPSAGNWTVSDGEATVALPSDTAGRTAVGSDPAVVRTRTNATVAPAPGSFSLANAGERVVLRRDGRAVDAVRYADAPEGERRLAAGDPRWLPRGFAPREVHAAGPATARAFVLPDAPDAAVEALRGADRRILLAGYTFSSPRVADALIAAADRGVRVRVLVDGAPVGGTTRREARLLDRLVAAGIEVRALGGPRARFDYHHAKYAVVDDAALVLTENWKPAGVGGRDSRGWGVSVASATTADALAAVFDHDVGWRDARPWTRVRANRSLVADDAATEAYPSRIDPATVSVERVRLLTAPDNAESAVVGLIDGADERVDVLQPTVGGRNQSMLRTCLRAAERGVRVRILLSNAWYVAEENRALVARLNRRAAREDLPLEARVADPRGRYGKVHAKGLVVDDVAVVGSMNWNDNSARENREVALALSGAEAADYYRSAFVADWEASGDGGRTLPGVEIEGLPAELLGAAGVAALGAMAYARRRVTFGGGGDAVEARVRGRE